MIVVADSSPLHYLIVLEQTELLRRFYDEVVIPGAVAIELRAGGSPRIVTDWLSAPPSWLTVIGVDVEDVAAVTRELDLGEREAIALAEKTNADFLLIDETAGRAEARRRGLRITGTLGVLRTAAEAGLVDVADVLARLEKTNFYVDEALIGRIFAKWLQR
jgi:predicted nucleic acid-binding protein